MFALQVGFMSPSFVGTVVSIEMVIFCAVGGRLSLIGAVYGALLVNLAKTMLSETFPQLWIVFMGALFTKHNRFLNILKPAKKMRLYPFMFGI